MVKFSLINAVDFTTIIFMVMLGLLLVALLVVPFFQSKKRAKQADELHRSLQPGDLVKTIGGVIGTIVEIREISPVDKEMVIETGIGDNKTTMTFDLQALYQVMSRSSTIVPVEEPKHEELNEEPVAAPIEEQPAPVAEEPKPTEEPVTEEPAVNAEQPKEEPAPVAEQAATEAATPARPQKKSVNSGAKKSGGTKSSNAKSKISNN